MVVIILHLYSTFIHWRNFCLSMNQFLWLQQWILAILKREQHCSSYLQWWLSINWALISKSGTVGKLGNLISAPGFWLALHHFVPCLQAANNSDSECGVKQLLCWYFWKIKASISVCECSPSLLHALSPTCSCCQSHKAVWTTSINYVYQREERGNIHNKCIQGYTNACNLHYIHLAWFGFYFLLNDIKSYK